MEESGSAIRVCLYVAVSTAGENQKVPASFSRRVKRAAGQALDVASWFALRRASIRFHLWDTRPLSNKGDIAIRESIKQQILEAFAPRPVIFREIPWDWLEESFAEEVNRSCDVFVIAGSGYVFPDQLGELPQRMNIEMNFLRRLTCTKVAYGIGWNSLLSDHAVAVPLSSQSRTTLKALFQSLDLIAVRDRPTEALIVEVTGCEAQLTGDPALFYHSESVDARSANISDRLRIGVNFAAHGRQSAQRLQTQFPRYCALLRGIAKDHRVTFHYVQHAHTERIVPWMLLSQGIAVERHDPPFSKLLEFYRGLDVHLCEMMHSSILSIDAEVPTVNIAYDIKNGAFFDLMGLSQYCYKGASLDVAALRALVTRAIAERVSIRAQIRSRKTELRRELDNYLARFTALVLSRKKAGAAAAE